MPNENATMQDSDLPEDMVLSHNDEHFLDGEGEEAAALAANVGVDAVADMRFPLKLGRFLTCTPGCPLSCMLHCSKQVLQVIHYWPTSKRCRHSISDDNNVYWHA